MNRKFGLSVIAALLFIFAMPSLASATFPGTNGPVAYSDSNPDTGYSNIYLRTPGGNSELAFPLTGTLAAEWPALDNGSERVVFVMIDQNATAPESPFQIYIAPLDGGPLVKLTSSEQENSQPSFSPDGEWVVFIRYDGAGSGRIYKIRTDGTGEVGLSAPSQDSDTGPAFSPDGTKIAFLHYDVLQEMDADGSNITTLAPDANRFPDGRVDYSPDGETIAFESEEYDGIDGNVPGGLQSINVDGTGRASLLDQYGTNSPTYSPDMTSIAYFYGGLSRSSGRRTADVPPGGLVPESPGINIGSLTDGSSVLLDPSGDSSFSAIQPYWGNEVAVDPPVVDPPVVDPPVVDPPVAPECKLRVARARLFVYLKQDAIRLVARYRSPVAGVVKVKFWKADAKGNKAKYLGSLNRKFDKRGKFRIRKETGASQTRSLRGPGPGFVAELKIRKSKGYCGRTIRMQLDDLRRVQKQYVWFDL